jgi:hypothetical protein
MKTRGRFGIVLMILSVVALRGVNLAQNGGTIPPPDIVGGAQQIANASTQAQLQQAKLSLLKQQAELARQQKELLKQETAIKAAADAATKNAWHIKDQNENQVMIECARKTRPEVLTKANLVSIVCEAESPQPADPK